MIDEVRVKTQGAVQDIIDLRKDVGGFSVQSLVDMQTQHGQWLADLETRIVSHDKGFDTAVEERANQLDALNKALQKLDEVTQEAEVRESQLSTAIERIDVVENFKENEVIVQIEENVTTLKEQSVVVQ